MLKEGTEVFATETCEEMINVEAGTPGTIIGVEDYDDDYPYLVDFGEVRGEEWCRADYIAATKEVK